MSNLEMGKSYSALLTFTRADSSTVEHRPDTAEAAGSAPASRTDPQGSRMDHGKDDAQAASQLEHILTEPMVVGGYRDPISTYSEVDITTDYGSVSGGPSPPRCTGHHSSL